MRCVKNLLYSKLGGSVKTVSLKLNGFNRFRNNIQIYHGYIKREKIVFRQRFYIASMLIVNINVNTFLVTL